MISSLTIDQLIFLNFPIQLFVRSAKLKSLAQKKNYISLMDFPIITNKMIDFSQFPQSVRREVVDLIGIMDIKAYRLYDNAVKIDKYPKNSSSYNILFHAVNFLEIIQVKLIKGSPNNLYSFYSFLEEQNEPTDEQIVFLNKDINIFGISHRALNFFKSNNYENFSDIIHFDQSSLFSQKNIGRNTVEELGEIIMKYDLWFGMPISENHKLTLLRKNNFEKYSRVIKILEEQELISFNDIEIENIIGSNGSEDSRRFVFEERVLKNYTLEDVGKKLFITRERVRQIEKLIIINIINKLGIENLKKNYSKFSEYFNTVTNVVSKTNLIINTRCFRGIEQFPNFHHLITKLSLMLYEMDTNIIPIFSENIDGEIIFYSGNSYKNQRQLTKKNVGSGYIYSYDNIQDEMTKYYNSSELKLQSNRKNLVILGLDRLKNLGRQDLSEYIHTFIDNSLEKIKSPKLAVENYFRELDSDKLLSTKEFMKLVSTDEFLEQSGVKKISTTYLSNIKNTIPNVYEFARGYWGHEDKFLKFSSNQIEILTDLIFNDMKEDSFKQYNSSDISEDLKINKKKYLVNNNINITDIDSYQLNVALKKSQYFNTELFYLGRNIWTVDKNQKSRKEIKYLLIKYLSEQIHPVQITDAIKAINSERQMGQFMGEGKFENYIDNNIKEVRKIQDDGFKKLILKSNINSNKYEDANIGFKKSILKPLILKPNINSNEYEDANIPKGLTAKQLSVYKYISSHIEEKNISPTISEIASAKNISISNAQRYLDKLEKYGHVKPRSKRLNLNAANLYLYKTKVEEYIFQNNSFDIPPTYKDTDNFRIGSITYHLRRKYYAGTLPKTTINYLENIAGWQWQNLNRGNINRRDKIHYRCKILQRYYTDTGRTSIAKNTKIDGYDLAKWVGNIRKKYRDNKLTENEIGLLESVTGWEWTGKRGKQKKYPM